MEWSDYNKLITDNLETFLDYFEIDYSKSGECYNFQCPFHEDADSPNGFGIYRKKDYVVAYCRTNCPKNLKRDGLNFVRRLLSRTVDTSLMETCKFVLGLLNKKLPEQCIENFDPDKSIFISAFSEKMEVQTVTNLTREDIRARLSIPAVYYLNRGYSAKILNEYDVGLCETKGKKFYNRVVIPCYNENASNYIGCTTRSQYEKCELCKYYHPKNKICPITGWDKYISSKWIHENITSSITLFNTWKAKESIRQTRKAILVEGPGDSISLSDKGIMNSLAIFGNTLKAGQANVLDSLGVMDLIVLLDNDKAGQAGCLDIKEKYGRFYRLYFPKLKGIKDVGEIQTDKETEDIRALLAQIG
jgi:5S rRNA maturation endonuclease (ribonuclease M5)